MVFQRSRHWLPQKMTVYGMRIVRSVNKGSRREGVALSTAQKMFGIAKKLLCLTALPETFICRIRLTIEKAQKRSPTIPGKFGKLDATDPTRMMLETWAADIMLGSRIKSHASIRNTMTFIPPPTKSNKFPLPQGPTISSSTGSNNFFTESNNCIIHRKSVAGGECLN